MLKVQIERLGRVVLLHVHGAMIVGPGLDAFQESAVAVLDASVLVIDLAGVSRIDAAGVGVLLKLREQTESTGREFRLMNVTKLVRQVLEISRLDSVFEVWASTDVAAAASTESAVDIEDSVGSKSEGETNGQGSAIAATSFHSRLAADLAQFFRNSEGEEQ
jgi:anti-sigma B factor antagonist